MYTAKKDGRKVQEFRGVTGIVARNRFEGRLCGNDLAAHIKENFPQGSCNPEDVIGEISRSPVFCTETRDDRVIARPTPGYKLSYGFDFDDSFRLCWQIVIHPEFGFAGGV